MQEFPISIGVISFVAGLVLLIAAVVGQKIEIAAVKMPELVDPKRRALTAVLGAALLVFGFAENRSAGSATASNAPAAAPARPTQAPASAPQAASNTAADAPPGLLACLAGIPAADAQIIPVEPDLRTDRKFGSGQPREGAIALQFTRAGVPVGAVVLRTLQSGLGFRVERVVDGACAAITSYANVSNPGAPNGVAANYETMEYRFPAATVRMDVAYCEDRDCIALRAQQIAP